MISIRKIRCSLAVITLSLFGCGSSTKNNGGTALNNCNDSDFHVVAGTSTTVTFAPYAYSPRCLQVSPGTTATFSGIFSEHPLTPGVAPNASGTGSAGSPLMQMTSGTSMPFTFNTVGDYPYYCGFHYQTNNMMGAVRVR